VLPRRYNCSLSYFAGIRSVTNPNPQFAFRDPCASNLTPFVATQTFHTKLPSSLFEHNISQRQFSFHFFEMMMEAMNDNDIVVLPKQVDNGEPSQVCYQQELATGDSNLDSDPVDVIIHMASRLEKLFRCGPCDAYVRKQVEFERSSPDGILPMEMQMYQAFLSDD
jgi:hypothetical protein